jgi:uncharacterized Tic20 family protein
VPNKEEQNWAIALHLSVFAGYIVPLAGLVAPVAIWMTKREQSAYLDAQGKELINMLISVTIWAVPVALLCFVLVGVPLAIILGVYCVATPIVAAVKAANGESFHYPLTFRILK